ncbi:MAG: DUF1700 domain-containing protein [Lachnospiraceae bacterium]|uniref:DUF1700 domain-containing protein n=1 Tax=Lachnospiraceae TaxID=186803 RepID=UPI0024BC978A|nr:DUF1700 domain-containing protein [Parablautia sp. Marseille-Q6255]
MTKNEFLDALGRMLNRELSEEEVRSNVNYYANYIEQQVRGGKTEEQVLLELGDPRLIARTILQVDQQKEEAYGSGYGEAQGYDTQTVYTENADGTYQESYEDAQEKKDPFSSFNANVKVHGFGWKQWLVLILVLLVIFMILGTVFAVMWQLLPFILLGAGLYWLYKRFLAR